MHLYLISQTDSGRTLGNFLKKKLALPTSLIHKLLRKKKIKLNGLNPDLNWKLAQNFELKIYANLKSKNCFVQKISIPIYQKNLQIIYEDQNLLAINKQPGIATQPSKNIPFEKSLCGIVDYYGQKNKFTPYLLHRLDKDTSGVILFAKNEIYRTLLHKLFQKKLVKKNYLALVKGNLTRENPIIEKIYDNTKKLVEAKTSFRVKTHFRAETLVEVYPETGKFHQIRQHFKIIGYPIVHDELYGDFQFNKEFQKKYRLKRQFLHAHKAEFMLDGKEIIIQAALPFDLEQTLKLLEKESKLKQAH